MKASTTTAAAAAAAAATDDDDDDNDVADDCDVALVAYKATVRTARTVHAC